MQLFTGFTATQRRQFRLLAVLFVLSLFELYAFGLGNKANVPTTFGFTLGNEWVLIHKWIIGSQSGSYLFASIAAISSVAAIALVRVRKSPSIGTALSSITLLMSFLCWAAAGKFIPLTGLLQGSLLPVSYTHLRTLRRHQYRYRRSAPCRGICIRSYCKPDS